MRLKISLRALFVALSLIGVTLAIVSWSWRRADVQSRAVAYIESHGNVAVFDNDTNDGYCKYGIVDRHSVVQNLLHRVVSIEMRGPFFPADSTLAAHVGGCELLEELYFEEVDSDSAESEVDVMTSWQPLRRLRRLRSITLPDYQMVFLINMKCPLVKVGFRSQGELNADQAMRLAEFHSIHHLYNVIASPEAFRGIGQMTELESLQLDYSQGGDGCFRELKNLQKLQYLSLKYMRVCDEDLRDLAALSSLQALDLTGTDVTDEGILFLADIHTLRDLDLSLTNIQGKTLMSFSHLNNLQRICLPRSASLERETLDALKLARPNLVVSIPKT
jgi:hypothetical protein